MTTVAMELSTGVPADGFAPVRKQTFDKLRPLTTSCPLTEDNIDISDLIFNNDEVWLYECPSRAETNLKAWLYAAEDAPFHDFRLSTKNIDTRTFTRPKKRFVRPSIEKYNEELYGNDLKELSDSGIQLNGYPQDAKPLHFDLEQTTSSVYFENMLADAPMTDSFQNMSPPSLVNSMCSSTFANLMESSFIKNDPVLREIRDTDYTGSILQQETEPMFQSITESCSSLSSDVPEYFLKKVSFNEKEDLNATVVLNATYTPKDDLPSDQTVILNKRDAKATNNDDLNVTYQRTHRAAPAQSAFPLNATFQRRKNKSVEEPPDLNSTITITDKKQSRDDKTIENVKRLLDRRPSPSLDLNRLSYLADEKDPIKAAFGESPKRNSFGSTDSGENLDYMSLSSGSSRSSKRQSIDSLNMIVDFPEPKSNMGTYRKSMMQQVMSTPKCRTVLAKTLWPNAEISPIGDRNSDPEVSSNELPPTVMQNTIRKQKSTGHINRIIPNSKRQSSAMRGSHPSLKSQVQKPTNLNSMGHTLKGSYTSLRPMNTNLPVAPPPLDTTVTVKATPIVAQVPPVPREVPLKSQDAQFARPQVPRSGLPRPVTGIPRPVSRIPGPKAVRPVSKSATHQGRY